MGFFDFLKKMNEEKQQKQDELLRWQHIIMPDSPNHLILSEEQLKAISIQQAEECLRIINDCLKLIETTIKPDVFFMRFNLLVEKSLHLCSLESFIPFSGASPMEAYKDIKTDQQKAIKQFLIRYFSDTFDKAEIMKTQKGKIGKYQKFYDSLQEYYCYMNDENIDYIETKYKAYTKT